jgi:hypothetical protein
MPCIRIEWLPVQLFALGLLGFDHLQLVYQPDDTRSRQDDWYVMEGVREVARDGTFPGIEGADGRTTLSVVNLAAREELVAKIGTPELRGSRCLACDGGRSPCGRPWHHTRVTLRSRITPTSPTGCPARRRRH